MHWSLNVISTHSSDPLIPTTVSVVTPEMKVVLNHFDSEMETEH